MTRNLWDETTFAFDYDHLEAFDTLFKKIGHSRPLFSLIFVFQYRSSSSRQLIKFAYDDRIRQIFSVLYKFVNEQTLSLSILNPALKFCFHLLLCMLHIKKPFNTSYIPFSLSDSYFHCNHTNTKLYGDFLKMLRSTTYYFLFP